jgi:hypothetical protein
MSLIRGKENGIKLLDTSGYVELHHLLPFTALSQDNFYFLSYFSDVHIGVVISSMVIPIVFGGGVPVGGNTHLTIRQDGTYSFTGHFHDSGATEYNMALMIAVKDS